MIEINKIYCEDCIETLKRMPDEFVQCVITSPPYWGLRDYGVNGQLGLEKTPEEYVEKIVMIFREIKRVLKKDGTVWLNLGDSYNGSGGEHKYDKGQSGLTNNRDKIGFVVGRNIQSLKPKDLVGIPWRVAFALQADGWYLRSDIIWHKPNPMPESVKDRPTKSHEYIFLLTKEAKYYYDADAIAESQCFESIERQKRSWDGNTDRDYVNGPQNHLNKYFDRTKEEQDLKRNKRSVWTVTTKPYKEAHFATYPPDLIKPCVLAGTKEGDIIYDPFMGAGTTALVALMYGRQFIGSELNPKYVEIANKRIEPYLKQTKMAL